MHNKKSLQILSETGTVKLALGFAVLLVSLASFNTAHAVFLNKTRIIIDNRQNYAEFFVFNRNDFPRMVTFGWRHSVVEPDGSFRTLKEGETYPGYMPADPYIQYSPRRVILQPRQHQRIKIYARRPADLPPGEYHSHFVIMSERQRAESDQPQVTQGMHGRIDWRAGVAIPIFLRQGETYASINIADAYITRDNGEEFFHISGRYDGTRSLYGTTVAVCQLPGGITVEKLITALRLYTEVKDFNVRARIRYGQPVLNPNTNQPIENFSLFQCESIKINITDEEDFEYKNKIFATTTLAKR